MLIMSSWVLFSLYSVVYFQSRKRLFENTGYKSGSSHLLLAQNKLLFRDLITMTLVNICF